MMKKTRLTLLWSLALLPTLLPTLSVSMPKSPTTTTAMEGPGKDAPLLPDSESMAAWELPMEHRLAGASSALALPDTRKLPQSTLEALRVEEFFSLWLVFLDDPEVVTATADAHFTVMAPVNTAPSASASALLRLGQAAAEDAVLGHLVDGERMLPEAMLAGGPQRRRTMGGGEVTFRIDEQGRDRERERDTGCFKYIFWLNEMIEMKIP